MHITPEGRVYLGIDSGKPDAIPLCSELGWSINVYTEYGKSLLSMAVMNNRTDYIEALIENGANVNLKEKSGFSPLHYCLQAARGVRDVETAKQLISHGADVNQLNDLNRTPLYLAVYYNNKDLVKLFLDSGADVSIAKNGFNYILQANMVEHRNDTEVLKLLIEAGVDINAIMPNRNTPLFESVFAENDHKLRLLLESGADVNGRNKDGLTPIYRAAFVGSPELIGLLAGYGANVNDQFKEEDNKSVLHIASYCENNAKKIKALIDCGANIEAVDFSGKTPIFHAMHYLENFKMLVRLGANVNHADDFGETPLHKASYSKNSLALIILLIESGADPLMENAAKKTPYDIAMGHSTDEVRDYLSMVISSKDAINDVNKQNVRRRTKGI